MYSGRNAREYPTYIKDDKTMEKKTKIIVLCDLGVGGERGRVLMRGGVHQQ